MFVRVIPAQFIMAAITAVIMIPACPDQRFSAADQGTRTMSLEEMARDRVHHGEGVFLNPFSETGMHRRDMLEIVKWKFLSENRFEAEYANEKVVPVKIDWKAATAHSSVSITWINHASVLIRENGSALIVDPVLFGLFWPVRDFSPIAFPVREIPPVDAVLVTHGHYDHLDIDSLKVFMNRSRYIVPLGHGDLLRHKGMTGIQELDWLDRTQAGAFDITFLPSNHWTMRNPFTGPNTALWGSYLIRTSSGRTIYISGDTAYFDRFAEIGRMARIDLAIFNLGAYEPRWFMKRSHINPGDTVKAFKELGADKLLVVHWGTFRLGDEPVYRPIVDIRREMAKAGISDRLVELVHGQTMYLE